VNNRIVRIFPPYVHHAVYPGGYTRSASMARLIKVKSYQIRIATGSLGFNEWRRNIIVRSDDFNTYCDIRFVDNPVSFKGIEKVRENGPSQLYLPLDAYDPTVDLLPNEEPLYMVLYESSNRAMIQSSQEAPGEAES
jgi:hypothetical protein